LRVATFYDLPGILLNNAPAGADGNYVLYWMQMNRRVESNHALAHAVDIANQNGLPLLVYEGLTCTYTAANDRIHTFMLEAVPGTAAELAEMGAGYLFYLRACRNDPNDLLYRLAEQARCVVTDDYPSFIAADHNRHVPDRLGIPFIAVESSCIVPMSRHDKRAYGAYTIVRRSGASCRPF
jgi:deoxyribodipyrimidine photo-lyase